MWYVQYVLYIYTVEQSQSMPQQRRERQLNIIVLATYLILYKRTYIHLNYHYKTFISSEYHLKSLIPHSLSCPYYLNLVCTSTLCFHVLSFQTKSIFSPPKDGLHDAAEIHTKNIMSTTLGGVFLKAVAENGREKGAWPLDTALFPSLSTKMSVSNFKKGLFIICKDFFSFFIFKI